MVQQRIHKRGIFVSRRRMNDHSFGFVHHQQMVILIDDIKRDILRLQFERFEFGFFDCDLIR